MIYKLKRFLIVILFFGISFISFGADPVPDPPPCPTGGGTVGGDPQPNSPIEDGVAIVLGLALFYGGMKFHQVRKKLKRSRR